ncbi:hypothetical protein ACWDYJ_33125 [Streptomyces sp. NPDC003042]
MTAMPMAQLLQTVGQEVLAGQVEALSSSLAAIDREALRTDAEGYPVPCVERVSVERPVAAATGDAVLPSQRHAHASLLELMDLPCLTVERAELTLYLNVPRPPAPGQPLDFVFAPPEQATVAVTVRLAQLPQSQEPALPALLAMSLGAASSDTPWDFTDHPPGTQQAVQAWSLLLGVRLTAHCLRKSLPPVATASLDEALGALTQATYHYCAGGPRLQPSALDPLFAQLDMRLAPHTIAMPALAEFAAAALPLRKMLTET